MHAFAHEKSSLAIKARRGRNILSNTLTRWEVALLRLCCVYCQLQHLSFSTESEKTFSVFFLCVFILRDNRLTLTLAKVL